MITRIFSTTCAWAGGFFAAAAINDLVSGYAADHIMLAVGLSVASAGLWSRT